MKRNKVAKQNQNSKKLLEDINSIINETNYSPNKDRVSKDFRIDDEKRKKKYKFFLVSFNKLNSDEQAELISLLTSLKNPKNTAKVADELAI